MYDPLTGRFLTRNSAVVSVPDGSAYDYVRNNPANALDPSGRGLALSSSLSPSGRPPLPPRPPGPAQMAKALPGVTISVGADSATNLEGTRCGDRAQLLWDFGLTGPAPCNGYVVQQVDVVCVTGKCDKCSRRTFSSKPITYSYWEARYVEANKTLEFVDGFASQVLSGCGKYSQHGTARFFCKDDIQGAGLALFKVGAQAYGPVTCPTTGGPLSYGGIGKQPPPFWRSKPSGPATCREAGIIYDCCDFNHRYAYGFGYPSDKNPSSDCAQTVASASM